MKNILNFVALLIVIGFFGCNTIQNNVEEVTGGYNIKEGTVLKVLLSTPLNSNINTRGDQFVAKLKEPILYKNETVLKKNTIIRGLVTRITKYEKPGDRAGLTLRLDQIAVSKNKYIPMAASLDTEKGSEVIKIKGKATRNTKIVTETSLIGAMVGKSAIKNKGGQKGLIVGAVAGIGAVILSDMKEVKLPVDTELIIRLEEDLFIPK